MLKVFLLFIFFSGCMTKVDFVMVGGEADLDACSLGQIKADNTALRSAPSNKGSEVSTLSKGTQVYLCDVAGEAWQGVVYSADNQDCGVTSPIPEKKAYDGACQSGWVESAQLELLAG